MADSVEAQYLNMIRATWPELDQWRLALRSVFIPTAGSELARDNLAFPPAPTSEVARLGLAVASDHLQAVRIHLDRPEGHVQVFPFAQLTLCRSALIGAAQAVWVLAPDDRAARVERGLRVAAYSYDEGRKAVGGLLEAAPQDSATGVVHQHLSQRATEVDRARASCSRWNTTEMVREAAEHVFDDPVQAAAVTSVWRFGSGAAHGLLHAVVGGYYGIRPTPEQMASATPPAADAELQVFTSGGDLHRIANAYLAVHSLSQRGWELLRQRGM